MNMMETINIDAQIYISNFLRDVEKIKLSMCCKKLDQLKHNYRYADRIDIDKICALPYYNNFTKIKTSYLFEKIIGSNYLYGNKLSIKLPINLINLKCSNIDILLSKNMISNSVTHLKLTGYINTNIKNLPSHITNLNLGTQFFRSIDNMIPSSITYLALNYSFIGSIENNIPSSVFCLKVGMNFQRNLKHIPPTVIHLIFYSELDWRELPATVTILTQKRTPKYLLDTIPTNLPPTVKHFYRLAKK